MTAGAWPRAAAGGTALACLVLLVGTPFLVLPLATGATPSLGVLQDAYIRGVLRFTLMQAALSALLSAFFGVLFALALHRTQFPGRHMLLRLFLLPQALPTLVAALGILAIFGRSGFLSEGLAAFGLARLDIYGLSGILLAHVFFNMPLAARIGFAALSAVPAESWKLAGQLSLGRVATFRIVEWPAIRSVLPGILTLVFMLCVTSFALVLVLGGGPGATTLEVAIYQSLRYDFDPGRVIALSLMQIIIVSLVLVPASFRARSAPAMFTLGARARRYERPGAVARVADIFYIACGLCFMLAPFAAIIANGLKADLPGLVMQASVQKAMVTSLIIAVLATGCGLVLSLALVFGAASRRSGAAIFTLAGSIVLVVPPVVVGAGWFLMLQTVGAVSAMAPVVVILANAVMAVPFMMRILGPALDTAEATQRRLALQLGLSGLAYGRLVLWPTLRRPLGLAAAFGLALSLGDLGVVALFGSQDLVTLPYLLLQRMGSYRTNDAAGLALILAAGCLALMMLAERGSGARN